MMHILPMRETCNVTSHHFLETEVTNSYSLSQERKQYETEISQSYVLNGEHILYDGDSIDVSNFIGDNISKDDLEDVGNPQIGDMDTPSQYRYVVLNYSQSQI